MKCRFLNPGVVVLCLLLLSGTACEKKDRLTDGGTPAPQPQPQPQPQPNPLPTTTPPPTTNVLGIYNDSGGILGDPDVLLFLGGPMGLTEVTGGAVEGSKFLRFTNADNTSFWGITYAKNNPSATRDHSSFAGASLRFNIRLARALTAGEIILVDVKDPSTGTPLPLTSEFGFSSSSLAWQNISIPLSRFGANKAQTQVPVGMNFSGLASGLGFDIDNIRWE